MLIQYIQFILRANLLVHTNLVKTRKAKKYVAQSKFVEGHVVFKLNEKATKGIYKLVYAVPQNEYNFDLIYNGKEDIELKFNLNDGAIFLKSSENILLFSYLSELTSLGKLVEVEFSKNQILNQFIKTFRNLSK